VTLPKSFAPVRQACGHYPDFCPRNAVEGSDRCEQHQQPRIVAEALPLQAPLSPAVPPGAIASPEAYDLAGRLLASDEDLEGLLVGRRVRYVRPPKPEPRQQLLPFVAYCPGSTTLEASPQRPFKPRGLMLWDAGDLNVEATYVGNCEQLLCSWGKVPAAWWSTQASFEEVCKALADGKEAASWGTWDSAHPGVRVRLTFDGDCSRVRAVMWGLSL